MNVLAADMPLLSAMLFCTEAGASAALAPLPSFGNVLLHEQALLTTLPVQPAQEFPLPSTALTLSAPLLEAGPEADKEEALPPDNPLEEEAQALDSILQTVQTLLHSMQARMTLPGLVSDVSPALPGPTPQESTLTPQAQRSIALPRAEPFSGSGHAGTPQATEAALLPAPQVAEGPVRDGMASGADNLAGFPAVEMDLEPDIAPSLARVAQHEVELSSHAVGSAGQVQETALHNGRQRTSGLREEAHFLVENAPAVQTPMHFTGGGRVEGQSGAPVSTSAEARAPGLTQQTVSLPPEPVAPLSERSSPQHMLLLQLQPPELGAMRIRLRLAQAQLSASFWADSPEVRSLLQSHFPTLHQNLSEQGFQVQQLSMSLTTGDFSGHLGHSAQQYQTLPPHVYRTAPPVAEEQNGDAVTTSPGRRSVARRGFVDVVI
jgi:flagellar hook-length control protein FliK